MQNKVAAFGGMQVGGQGNFATEFVGCASFAFADTFHFGSVPGLEITFVAALLLRDMRSAAQDTCQSWD